MEWRAAILAEEVDDENVVDLCILCYSPFYHFLFAQKAEYLKKKINLPTERLILAHDSEFSPCKIKG